MGDVSLNLQIPKKFQPVSGHWSLCGDIHGRRALQVVGHFASRDCSEIQMCESSCRQSMKQGARELLTLGPIAAED